MNHEHPHGHDMHEHMRHDGHGAVGAQDAHAGHRTGDFLRKFWLSFALAIPIFLYSEMAMDLFGIRGPVFPLWQYVMLVLGSIVYFYCGGVFLKSAYGELRARLPGMMTLIAIAITAAYAYSVVSVVTGGMHELLFELASLITIMLLGHYIEMRAVTSASGALAELSKLLPDTAEVFHGTATTVVPLAELKLGDLVLVRPGAKIPADGMVMDGRSDVNEAILTGESKPVPKAASDLVIAGSINGEGSLMVRVATLGEQTFLAGVMRLVAQAQSSKSRLQMLSDRAAYYLTIIAIAVGAVTFVAWLLVGAGLVTATERLVAVLVIACPHALGLAVPLVAAISTTLAARGGLLVRERSALEGARTIDTVLFDKTGTLTTGQFGVDAVIPGPGVNEDDVLQTAAAVNAQSEHPLARAIVAAVQARRFVPLVAEDFRSIPGKGATARIEGEDMFVGNESLLTERGVNISQDHHGKLEQLAQQGKTVIHVFTGTRLIGSIALADTIREESREAIRALQGSGITTVMITGDSEDVAQSVAHELGIDEYFAGVLPQDKAEKVKLLQHAGRKVAMVGDGVNDAPALAQADLGIAIGAGTNVAIESAGIILVKSDPRDIPKIFTLSKLTYRKMIQNLFWATGYNIVAIPLAAGALAAYGVILQPAVAAVFMSASTVIVAVNAVLLRRARL